MSYLCFAHLYSIPPFEERVGERGRRKEKVGVGYERPLCLDLLLMLLLLFCSYFHWKVGYIKILLNLKSLKNFF